MGVCHQRPRRAEKHQSLSSRNAPGTVQQLQQTQSTEPRSQAIIYFCRGLRRGTQFQSFWDAVGGAVGLADLMAEFSLHDVRSICKNLGATASAKKARPERQAGIAELVRLLHDDGPGQRDPRPLRKYYQDIVPACDLDVVREWDHDGREWNRFQRVCLLRNHPAWFQERFLQDLSLLAGGTQRTVAARLFQDDLAYAETLLSTLIDSKEGEADIPSDFMSAYVMPLLKRLVRPRKYDDKTRDKFLNLVVRCVDVHARELTSRPITDLVRYAIKRWSAARDSDATTDATKQQTELCLRRLVELMPPPQYPSLQNIRELLLAKDHVDNYHLLRLLLLHTRGYELDIDDGSPLGLSRLKDLAARTPVVTSSLWPMGLFLHLDVENSIGLFERLSAADVVGNFLTPEQRHYSSSRTVLEKTRFSTSYGDAEIVRCLLLAKSSKNNNVAREPAAWLVRARTLIRERRKKAEEGREWHQREFLATSAINLCVAAGDLEMLDDTILWARRFNNQPMVAQGLYDRTTFGTEEIIDLLSAIPGKENDGADAAAVRKAIETSGRIIVHLMETIKVCLSKHPAENRNWHTLLQLPKLVVDRRLEAKNAASFDELFEPALGSDYVGSGAVEAVWKPTIESLVVAEGLLATSDLSIQATGTYVLQNFPGRSGNIRADLASFLLQKMKMHLSAHQLGLQVYKVVGVVTGIARSNQPWLAIPFIRDFILEGEGTNSTWHRQLLGFEFLSSLPYKAASALLHSMAKAMSERMQEQNARPREKRGADNGEKKPVAAPPAIKVTTVKMMAQLLQDSQFIGLSESCDMLLALLAEARHIDALVAITSSLLSILEKPAPAYSPDTHTRVLDALEEYLSPVLPRLSQHRALSEEDWAAVESGEAELPDVSYDTPLTSLLIDKTDESDNISTEAKTRLIELLMRVPAQSALYNARWNKLFLTRNGFSIGGEHLPDSPACLDVSIMLLREFPAYVPASMLAELRDMALVNLDPTPGIARVTAAVKANPDLVNSNAGGHWLSQFDNPGDRACDKFGIVAAESLLQGASGELSASKRDGGLTVQVVGETVVAVADRIIARQDPEAFERLVLCLCFEPIGSRRENWLAWREHCVPLLRTLSAKVDGLRGGRPGEVPKVLPSSFQLHMGILPIPYSKPPKEPSVQAEVDAFVPELAGLLEWLAERRVPYHKEFAEVRWQVRERLSSRDYARVALGLGRLGGGAVVEEGGRGLTLAGYLMLELAGHLLAQKEAMDEGCGVLPEVKQMVSEWVGSDDELVRLAGATVEKRNKAVFPRDDEALSDSDSEVTSDSDLSME